MISNSSPLIFLTKINRLNLLKILFEEITISSGVKEEILFENKPGFLAIRNAIEEGWIRVVEPKRMLDIKLGKGENSVISLAKEKNERLIIDDALGVRAAKSLGIDAIRTTSVILIALKRKEIKKKEAITLINKLLEEGYYISPKYYARLFEKLEMY